MINIKKGPAHSLGQSDVRGKWDGSTAFVAGQVAFIDSTGTVQKGFPVGTTTQVGIAGFVIDGPVTSGAVAGVNGSVNESGKIALYTLDGTSIIETDQIVDAITSFTVGKPVYGVGIGSTTTANVGKVTITSATAAGSGPVILGWVEGVRYLQKDSNNTFSGQNYTSVDSQGNQTTASFVYKGQTQVQLVAIKLASTSAAHTTAGS
jgi:hypothetical protein